MLQLAHASNLKAMPLGSSAALRVGQRVTALGNAGGAGGRPSAAAGTITSLHRSIVAQDDQGNSEQLANLIETDAPVRPGDWGGPLVNEAGRAIGIVTAGSSSFRFQSGGLGYAIPINKARALARTIAAGGVAPSIHLGPTAFLGVSVAGASGGGAQIVGVVPGSAAETAGLAAGDVVTSLGGVSIGSTSDLSAEVLRLTPGTSVEIDWIDQTGATQTAQITPASGPPQ